eukprot:CAMPEP_0206458098 /NCGR_PEP_ID=MMETSP0324_2-20121206/23358_1 /ASSEMBLY_ACC=CAM_ASM_000836 /TAXON_ID=2866 /ORGANISM="Crypthecodinium cohnii, Strain Seligo" /LENGTH=42 /DNA_ID= /DNA_START= /DNA_END= /DNA_ORIENTATION=
MGGAGPALGFSNGVMAARRPSLGERGSRATMRHEEFEASGAF